MKTFYKTCGLWHYSFRPPPPNPSLHLPIRVVEQERVESGEGLGREVLAMESTDSREERLSSPHSSKEEHDCESGPRICAP